MTDPNHTLETFLQTQMLYSTPPLFSLLSPYTQNLPSYQMNYQLAQLQTELLYRKMYSLQTLNLLSLVKQQQTQVLQQNSFKEHSQPSLSPFKASTEVGSLELNETTNQVQQESLGTASIKSEVETIEDLQTSSLTGKIKKILHFFLTKFEKVNEEIFQNERRKYADDANLFQVFDVLKTRYSSSGKCREDMMRFVLRKAITYLRDIIRKENKLSAKAASTILCQKYFESKYNEMKNNNVDFEKEEEIVNFLLPYKKNSRNRTANSQFIIEIFASELFYADYLEYVQKLDKILRTENAKKEEKFIIFIEECIQEETIHKIKSFKRLPWLDKWIEATKNIARELSDQKKLNIAMRKPRATKKAKI